MVSLEQRKSAPRKSPETDGVPDVINADELLKMLSAGPDTTRGHSAAAKMRDWLRGCKRKETNRDDDKVDERVINRLCEVHPNWTREQARAVWEVYDMYVWKSVGEGLLEERLAYAQEILNVHDSKDSRLTFDELVSQLAQRFDVKTEPMRMYVRKHLSVFKEIDHWNTLVIMPEKNERGPRPPISAEERRWRYELIGNILREMHMTGTLSLVQLAEAMARRDSVYEATKSVMQVFLFTERTALKNTFGQLWEDVIKLGQHRQ